MSIASEASKLFTNKYFLYFMVFLAATNVVGYLVTNKINAVIFFALVSLLTFQFSKNMAVVLLVSIIATNFLMANKRMREGLENQEDITTPTNTQETSGSQSTATNKVLSKLENTDPEIAAVAPLVQNAKENKDVSSAISRAKSSNTSGVQSPPPIVDPNNEGLNKMSEQGPPGAGETLQGSKNKTTNGGPRIDYMTTIEDSYAHLDKLLGSDSIQNLSKDTKRLMEQQSNLYKTMEQMVPMIQDAKGMLDKLNVGGLTDTLKSMNLGGSPVLPTNK
jgi:hypothetical protein